MRNLTALAVVVLAAGCGDDPGSPVAIPTDMASLVVAIPPPNATPSASSQLPWAANFTVNVLERAGIGVELTEIVVELMPPVVFDRSHIILGARNSRVEPRGTLSVPLTLAFQDPALDVQVAVRGTDDRGNAIEAFGRLVVIPAQRP